MVTLAICNMNGPTGWTDYLGTYNYQPGSYDIITTLPGWLPSHVIVTGLIQSSVWNMYAITGILPLQLVPNNTCIFSVQGNPNINVRLDITTNGAINYEGGSAGPGWLSYAGIIFPTIQAASWYTFVSTFYSTWSNYGAYYGHASYYQEGGMTYLSGLVTTTQNIGSGLFSPVFALPSGYAPIINTYAVAQGNPNQAVCVWIDTQGVVSYYADTSATAFTGWMSLNGIVFGNSGGPSWYAAPMGAGGWGMYDTSGNYATIGSMVFLRGMAVNYNYWLSGDNLVLTLPAGARPAQRQVFNAWNTNSVTGVQKLIRVDVYADGEVHVVPNDSSTAGLLSLSNIRFVRA